MTLENTKQNLEKRGFKVTLFETSNEATTYLNSEIHNVSVAFGGSVTLKEMNLFETLGTHNKVWWHNEPEQVSEYGAATIRNNAMTTEVYISSVNGLSESGQIINIDGTGNRIASTAFGHKKVYLIIGKNKIEDTFEKAMWRARNIAAPKNAKRLSLNTPCAVNADKCYDCSSPQRICRGFLIMEAPLSGQDTEIILINENLGY